jgi:NADH-quinone oxidoreductase subunit N
MNNAQSAMIVMPEIILAIFAMVQIIVGAIIPHRAAKAYGLLAILGLTITAYALYAPQRLHFNYDGKLMIFAFSDMFVDDAFARFVKLLMLIGAAMSIMLSWSYLEQQKLAFPEFPILITMATLGMMLMVSASNLLALYVGLELQSLALYVLAAYCRDDARSSEAGLKYFVLGALSSGLILYGISLVYGYAGTTDFVNLAYQLRDTHGTNLGVMVGVVFICAALAFKVSAVPFHMWTPDVYEGAPTPVTAFFAAATKIAGIALFTRLLLQPLSSMAHQWQQIIIFISVASMLLGSFGGLAQSNIKRLMAYSSIANVGYILVGLAVDSIAGMQAMLIYLAIYFVNVMGVFAVLLCLRRQGKPVEQMRDLAGLAKTNPVIALCMVAFMFSMAGVPPLAGFFGKYFVFLAAVKAHMVPLAIIGVLTSVVAAYYYLRIIKIMYFDEALESLDPLPDFGVRAILAISALYIVLFTLWPAPVIDSALTATRSFLGG